MARADRGDLCLHGSDQRGCGFCALRDRAEQVDIRIDVRQRARRQRDHRAAGLEQRGQRLNAVGYAGYDQAGLRGKDLLP